MNNPEFADLLKRAVTEPGLIHTAYSTFHGYSFGNQLLAMCQCAERGIEPGPIATYPKWKELGRQVRRGERAIVLCMPITVKRENKTDGADEPETEVFTRFVFRPNWFVMSQTDGQAIQAQTVPDWDRAKALETLGITEKPFEHTYGNVLGYAQHRSIAVNPVNPLPHKTTFHELAHILLGHTSDGAEQSDAENLPRSLREVEAESVALICCASLGLPGEEYSRGYIQNWLGSAPIPERSAQRIFHAADQILKAGH